jgi:hypothetical protein
VPTAVTQALSVVLIGKQVYRWEELERCAHLGENRPLEMVILGIHVPAEVVRLDIELSCNVLDFEVHLLLMGLAYHGQNDRIHSSVLAALVPTPAC